MSIKKSTLASVFIFVTFITTSVAQSSTTYDQCAPFYYCGDDPVFRKPQLSRFNFIHAHSTLSSSRKIDFFFFLKNCAGVIMVIKYVVGFSILIAVVVWQWKRRNLNTWNDNLMNRPSFSNEQN